jgi:hypothetical protein
MNALTKYYIHQAGGGRGGDIGPIYTIPNQRGHGIGDWLGTFFRGLTPIFGGIKYAGKEAAKFLGREALRTGSRILTDIADNPQTGYRDIISKHVQDSFQNLGSRIMSGKGRRRKRRASVRRRSSGKNKKRKRSAPRKTRKGTVKSRRKATASRKRVILKARRKLPPQLPLTLKRDIFS